MRGECGFGVNVEGARGFLRQRQQQWNPSLSIRCNTDWQQGKPCTHRQLYPAEPFSPPRWWSTGSKSTGRVPARPLDNRVRTHQVIGALPRGPVGGGRRRVSIYHEVPPQGTKGGGMGPSSGRFSISNPHSLCARKLGRAFSSPTLGHLGAKVDQGAHSRQPGPPNRLPFENSDPQGSNVSND